MSVSLFFHGDATIRVTARVVNQIFVQNVLEMSVFRYSLTYLFVRTICRSRGDVRVLGHHLVDATLLTTHQFLN